MPFINLKGTLRIRLPFFAPKHFSDGISISRRPAGDAKKFRPVAEKVLKLGKQVKIVILDKGYDDEKVHEFIREVMNAISIIPARNEEVPIHRTHGKYRKQMKRGYNKKQYHQRSKNETVNSVVKRKYGDGTLAMGWKNQNKEIAFRLILYAARRFISLFFITEWV